MIRLCFTSTCLACILLLSSCNDGNSSTNNSLPKGSESPLTPSESKKKIAGLKDSMDNLSRKDYRAVHQKSLSKESYENWLKKHQNTARIAYIEALTTHYHRFPKDPHSADCLWEVHRTFATAESYSLALAYGDTLLQQYPTYKGRKELLFSQALRCDQLDNPRDTPRLKNYLNQLLAMESLEAPLRAEIKNWIANADVPLAASVK